MTFHLDDDDAATSIYWDSELKCRQFMKIFFYYSCIQLSSFLGPLFPAFIDIFFMDNEGDSIDTSAWNLPFLVVMPFDMETISGWLMTWLYQLNISIAYGIYMIIPTTHFVCSCYWIIGICQYFARLIETIKFDTQKHMAEQQSKRWQNAKEKFQRAIEMHVKIYE